MTSDLYMDLYNIGHWYDLSPSLDVRFLAVIVTHNPCLRHVCSMSVTIY